MTPRDRVEHAVDRVERAGELMADKLAEVKPKLRGWLHAGTAPLALAAGIVLVALSPTASTRIGSAAFALSALLVFTVSAIYHRGTWSPRTWAFLRRFDHANIFVLIAGTYTPYALLFLEGSARTTLLVLVWGAALAGVVFRVFWIDAPRWLYTLGGVVYGLKRPNPSPRWFGFHEVFHSFTILAFAAHYVGVSLATYSLR